MTKIDDIKLLGLLPYYLQDIKDIKIIMEIVQQEIERINKKEEQLFTYGNFGVLDEVILDELAYQWKTEGYEQTFSKEIKSKLVEASYIVRKNKGTKGALLKVVNGIYGDASIKEWFEYGGDPHHFKVDVSEVLINKNEIEDLNKRINTSKRESSYLEATSYRYKTNTDLKNHSGISMLAEETINLYETNANKLVVNNAYGFIDSNFIRIDKTNEFIRIIPDCIYKIIDGNNNLYSCKVDNLCKPNNQFLIRKRGRFQLSKEIERPVLIEIIK